jgi:hypothetical protein
MTAISGLDPGRSYFQTLARLYSTDIESRSLTLSKFDFQGKPHVFYDDHLQLLRRSDCFVARKIWPEADKLYAHFLRAGAEARPMAEPNPGKIDRLFGKAVERRTRGRPGLYMQSRYPNPGWENGRTAGPYSVFEGFAELVRGFRGLAGAPPGCGCMAISSRPAGWSSPAARRSSTARCPTARRCATMTPRRS